MLKLYKDLNRWYMITAFLGAMGVVLPPVLRDESFLPQAIMGFVWIICCAVVFELLARKRLNKLIVLMNECHTQAFLDAYDKLHSDKKATQDFLSLNRSAGLLNIGRPRQALEQLQSISTDFRRSAAGAMMAATYYNNLFMAHLFLRDTFQAEQDLERMHQVLEQAQLKPLHRQALMTRYEDKRVLLNMTQGRCGGAEDYLTTVLESEETTLGKVSYHYWLARLCERDGRTQEAYEHMRFVWRSGGDTWYAREAAKMLKEADRSE